MNVTSKDGSIIGVEVAGDGPPMVLVHGTTATRARWAPVLDRLASRFTVYAMDRRGRGLSTAETVPYDIGREGEDIAAVAEWAGGDVLVVAHSYGSLCSLEAALVTSAIGRMVLYEPPAAGTSPPPGILDTPDPATMLEMFYRQVLRVSEADLAVIKTTPMWQIRLAAAPTMPREYEAVTAFEVSDRLSAIEVPVRLLLGTLSPPSFRPMAERLAGLLRSAEIVELPGQDHLAIDRAPELFTEAVLGFCPR